MSSKPAVLDCLSPKRRHERQSKSKHTFPATWGILPLICLILHLGNFSSSYASNVKWQIHLHALEAWRVKTKTCDWARFRHGSCWWKGSAVGGEPGGRRGSEGSKSHEDDNLIWLSLSVTSYKLVSWLGLLKWIKTHE